MSRQIVLDASPLGLVTHREGVPEAEKCRAWIVSCLARGDQILVPEIADYEVRRELIRAEKLAGVVRLDAFISAAPDRYLPITTTVMRRAAQFWAESRKRGKPTAPNPSLDADSILAAQATSIETAEAAIVATTNVDHISQFVTAQNWFEI